MSRVLGVGLLVGALTGCAAIPSSGPVERRDVTISELGPIFPQSYGPTSGASPQEIVQGFLSAQAVGINDDWATAREFLSPRGGAAWDPSARTFVYSGEPDFTEPAVEAPDPGDGAADDPAGDAPSGDDLSGVGASTSDNTSDPATSDPATTDPAEPTTVSILGHVSIVATLETDGQFTEAAQGNTQSLTFTLEKSSSDQWRITATEDGIFVSEPNFALVYRATTLYFPSQDRSFLVPDVRWYSKSNTASHAINGLLAGPATWLRDSVEVVAPAGTRLVLDSVTIDDSGVARVDLTKEVLAASDSDRAMLQAQMTAVLLKVPRVRSVELFANSLPLSIPTTADPQRDPVPGLTSPLVLAGDVISEVGNGTLTPLAGFSALTGLRASALATDDAARLVVLRSGTVAIMTAPTPAAAATTLVTGTDLVAPSVDRFGWVWTGDRATNDGLRAVTAAGTQVPIPVDWLDGRTLESIRVSHDGARIAIVSSLGGVSRIDVAAIVRDDSDVPASLSVQALAIGASVTAATQVVWIDESTVGVLARGLSSGIPTVYEVPISGRSAALSGVEDTVWISAGKGLRSVYVANSDGALFSRAATGSTWSQVVGGVQFPAFPG
ncbi:Sporulation and spore germination [Sanguibacter gelidistatuariae]|uniref:Sporulation and spore germination n=2 Tax=Sanguibacter gelidistatuariae TaxID=1814289 RepID=A0A1G6VTH8_9MICO|nr:Sporulation and spore germination [Sanguibacter gelidistatuariae]